MADFNDGELVILARRALQDKGELNWQEIHVQLIDTWKLKEALSRRLNTLKRTHGKDYSQAKKEKTVLKMSFYSVLLVELVNVECSTFSSST